MSLFNMFKSQVDVPVNGEMALVIALIYAIAADGEIAREEIGHLHSVLGGDAGPKIELGLKYMRTKKPAEFVEEFAPRLNRQQKLCILLNVIDSVMSDGHAAPEEQALVKTFQDHFGLDDATIEPYFSTLVIKNDRSVLKQKGF